MRFIMTNTSTHALVVGKHYLAARGGNVTMSKVELLEMVHRDYLPKALLDAGTITITSDGFHYQADAINGVLVSALSIGVHQDTDAVNTLVDPPVVVAHLEESNAIATADATEGNDPSMVTLAEALRLAMLAHFADDTIHVAADEGNAIVHVEVTDAAGALTFATEAKTKWNAHVIGLSHYQTDPGSAVTEDVPPEEGATLWELLNDIKAMYNLHVALGMVEDFVAWINLAKAAFNGHCADTDAHIVKDVDNPIATLDATDEIEASALANELVDAITAHFLDETLHLEAEVETIVTDEADPDDYSTWLALGSALHVPYMIHLGSESTGMYASLKELKDNYNAHAENLACHRVADVNLVTAADPGTSDEAILCINDIKDQMNLHAEALAGVHIFEDSNSVEVDDATSIADVNLLYQACAVWFNAHIAMASDELPGRAFAAGRSYIY